MSTPPLAEIAIVAIGDELRNGKISDTNSAYIAQRLRPIGIEVRSISIVGDRIPDICAAITRALEQSPYVVCTGGLGPTSDDRTRDALALLSKSALEVDVASLARIEAYCERRGRTLNENNRRQALFPAGATVIENTRGTADAFETEVAENRFVLALPGVPPEMKGLVKGYLIPRLSDYFPQRQEPQMRAFRIFGLAESHLGELVDRLELNQALIVSYRPQFPEILLEVAAVEPQGFAALEESCALLRERIGPAHIVSESAEESVPTVVARLLSEHGKSLACAESCSGGLLSDALIQIPGASQFLSHSVVAYSNQAKQRLLGISEKLLEEHGAVSEACAAAMATAVRVQLGSDFGLSVSGIAGPEGGTAEKPVGTIFIACATPEGTEVKKLSLPWDRQMNRRFSVFCVLDMLRTKLLALQQ